MYSSVFLEGNIFERILLLSYLCSAKQNNQNYMIMYSTHYRYYLTVATVAFVVFLCIRVISYLPYIQAYSSFCRIFSSDRGSIAQIAG